MHSQNPETACQSRDCALGLPQSGDWSAPIQSFTGAESTHLSYVSQLKRSHSTSLLCSRIVLAQSRDCKSVLHNLEIGMQFPDSDNDAAQSRDFANS